MPFNLGGPEMLVVLVVAVLLFGKRLPEVGRSLGKGIVEFKKGIRGVEDDIDTASRTPASVTAPVDRTGLDDFAASVPKFEPASVAPRAAD